MAGRSRGERAGTQWELWFKRGMTGRSKRMWPLDAAEIGEEKALHISQLMRVADFANLPEEVGSFTFDADEYRITARDGEWRHAVHWNNHYATPALKELFPAIEGLGTWVPEG